MTYSGFSLPQSTDVGYVIWSIGLCAAADPGHLFRRSLTGQCVKSYVEILHLDIQVTEVQVSALFRQFVPVSI